MKIRDNVIFLPDHHLLVIVTYLQDIDSFPGDQYAKDRKESQLPGIPSVPQDLYPSLPLSTCPN